MHVIRVVESRERLYTMHISSNRSKYSVPGFLLSSDGCNVKHVLLGVYQRCCWLINRNIS